MADFELWQDDLMVACVHAYDRDRAWREIQHYALMYGQDGPCKITGKNGRPLPQEPEPLKHADATGIKQSE
jgi:hypothetical protein